MIDDQRLIVVLPAFNAARTLRQTVEDLPDLVDEVLLTDDGSADGTVAIARELGLGIFEHPSNQGYGANQKTCYRAALDAGADLVVMIHPDYQYSPRLVTPLAGMLTSGHYDFVLGSRILGGKARAGGMPSYKYVANRLLTAFGNLLTGAKLSEHHTGLRAYTRELLEQLPYEHASDDFVFDFQMILMALAAGARIGEITCPTRYLAEASSIGLRPSVVYGCGCVTWASIFLAYRLGLAQPRIFSRRNHRADDD